MNKRSLLLFSFSLVVMLAACSKGKLVSRKDLKIKKTEYLLEQIDEHKLNFTTFSAKADIKLERSGKKQSFKSTLRLKKDSAIWMSITPLLGIEVARVLITKDTVKIINRLEKNYFIGDYLYINKRFNIEFDFDQLQAILLGNPIDFESDDKILFSLDKDRYYLGDLRKRKIKKADDKPQKIERKDEELLSLWIDPENFKTLNFLLTDPTADRILLGAYSDFRTVEKQLIPHKLNFEIQAEKPSTVGIEYSRVYLDKAIKFSFNISSKYEQVYY